MCFMVVMAALETKSKPKPSQGPSVTVGSLSPFTGPDPVRCPESLGNMLELCSGLQRVLVFGQRLHACVVFSAVFCRSFSRVSNSTNPASCVADRIQKFSADLSPLTSFNDLIRHICCAASGPFGGSLCSTCKNGVYSEFVTMEPTWRICD